MKKHRIRTVVVLAALAMVLASESEAHAAQPADLPEMLPQDTVIYIRLTALHGHWQDMLNSPLAKRIQSSPIAEIADGIGEMKQGIAAFEADTGINVEAALSALFGNDMVLAMFADESGVLITRSANVEDLRLTVDTIMATFADAGAIQEEKHVSYRGVDIHSLQLIKPEAPDVPPKETHYAIAEDTLIASRDLETVKRVIDVAQQKQPSLAAKPEFREAAKHFSSTAVGRAYFDTDRMVQVFDLEAGLNATMRNPFMHLVNMSIQEALPMTRYFAANVALDKDRMTIRSTLAYDEKKLQPEMRVLRPAPNTTLDIMDLVPEASVFGVGNRVNKAALWHFILNSLRTKNPLLAHLLDTGGRKVGQCVGGMDFERDVLTQIGEQAALIISPGDEKTVPALTLVIELSNGDAFPVAIRTLMGVAAAADEGEAEKTGETTHHVFKRTNYKGTDVGTLILKEPEHKDKFELTVLTLDRYLVLSTMPYAAKAVVDRYKQRKPYRQSANIPGTPATEGYVDMKLVVALLDRYGEFLVAEEVRKGKAPDVAASDFAKGVFLLGCFDRIEFVVGHAQDRVNREVLIHFAKK